MWPHRFINLKKKPNPEPALDGRVLSPACGCLAGLERKLPAQAAAPALSPRHSRSSTAAGLTLMWDGGREEQHPAGSSTGSRAGRALTKAESQSSSICRKRATRLQKQTPPDAQFSLSPRLSCPSTHHTVTDPKALLKLADFRSFNEPQQTCASTFVNVLNSSFPCVPKTRDKS